MISQMNSSNYTVLQKYSHIGLNQNLVRPTTLDIITRLHHYCLCLCSCGGKIFKRFLGSAWVEKSRISALGWTDDNSTMRGIMKRSVKWKYRIHCLLKPTFASLKLNRLYNLKLPVFKFLGELTYHSENDEIYHPNFAWYVERSFSMDIVPK